MEDKKEILFIEKDDRRLLPNVPDKTNVRNNTDRRGLADEAVLEEDYFRYEQLEKAGKRYKVDYPVKVHFTTSDGERRAVMAQAEDISTTGILLRPNKDISRDFVDASNMKLDFEITPGSMPEGYEMKIRKIPAHYVRGVRKGNGEIFFGLEFTQSL